ncbi:phosphate-binding protein [Prevotella sp. PCHR]|uniref:Phosphate-binding protein n=1 Tax=Xylanibacter caecicola TaxID=2736294 RepID=A0ABX2B0N4_9BACT|nr:substrate-binding domain-containing protein [Xylanibacter caecicola]NPE24801.1 phosphate-binding protein [Xylanibacter caecicola]
MTKKLFSNIFVGLITLGFFSACTEKNPSNRTDTYSSGKIVFAADESFSTILNEEKAVFESKFREAEVEPFYTNELDAINLLMKDSVHLVVAARDLTQKEKKNLVSRNLKAVTFPIGYDGLAFIVNKENTDTCITVRDVKRILSGEVKNWSDVYPGSKRGKIEVIFDNKQSSAVHFCVDSILGGKPINSENIVAGKTSKEVIDYVEATPGAIGIIGSNWLYDGRDTTNITFKKNINVMAVSKMETATPMNSWKPYQAYFLDGRYPFVRTIYALVCDPLRALPMHFAQFISDPTGQLIILKSGLLPYRGDIQIRSIKVNKE